MAKDMSSADTTTREIPCGPIVEIFGDGMAQVLWEKVREELIDPFVDLNTIEFDLSIENRDMTQNEVVAEAVEAIKKHTVCVKCATKTADIDEMNELRLRNMYPSPNHTIRNALGGVLRRETITFGKGVPLVRNWTKPAIALMLAEEDFYDCKEMQVSGKGKLEIIFTPHDSSKETIKKTICEVNGECIALAIAVTEDAIENFAISSFELCLSRKIDLYWTSNELILPIYDGRFCKIFKALHDRVYKCKMVEENLVYEHVDINRMARDILVSQGGCIWAMKYIEGDLISSFLYNGYGMMSSLFIGRDNRTIVAENYYGPPTLLFYQQQATEIPGFHPSDTIIAWALGLHQRASLDDNERLREFADWLQESNLAIIRKGFITADLKKFFEKDRQKVINSFEFIEKVRDILEAKLDIERLRHAK